MPTIYLTEIVRNERFFCHQVWGGGLKERCLGLSVRRYWQNDVGFAHLASKICPKKLLDVSSGIVLRLSQAQFVCY